MSLRLLKMQATGNDFLIVGPDQTAPPKDQRAAIARRYCHRQTGFGADGFLVIENGGWDFYNSDGSPAAMCGNAARAVGRLLLDQSRNKKIEFQTALGTVSATYVSDEIEVCFQIPSSPLTPLPYHSAVLINTGVPHAVIKRDDLKDRPTLWTIGREIKSHYPDGINVTYFSPIENSSIASVTFERGVEDFTLSCGTGALAAARLFLNGRDGNCSVSVPGGNLHVTFSEGQAILRGDAHYIGWCIPADGESKP